MVNLLGGKVADLAEMTSTGLPVSTGIDIHHAHSHFQHAKKIFLQTINQLHDFFRSVHELHLPPL